MNKLLTIMFILAFYSGQSARAFIFTDTSALAQRTTHLADHMGKWADQLGKMTTQIQKFQEYQQTFDQYYATINSIYRRVSHLSFANLLSTAQGVYGDAQRLGELLPSNEDYEYLDQIDYLTANPLYEENEEYRAYVDDLIQRHNDLVAALALRQQQLEAIRAVQQNRLEKFDTYEAANEAMSAGSGEASVTEQMALLNAIALEQARENHEIASMIRMMLERDLGDTRTAMDHLNRQAEINQGRGRNIQELLKLFGGGAKKK